MTTSTAKPASTATQSTRPGSSRPVNPPLNRRQKLLTAEQLRRLPAIYATEGQGFRAVAIVKFFCGPFTWYATEYNPATGEFFGVVYNDSMADQCPRGELGYFTAADLCAAKIPVKLIGAVGAASFWMHVERDLHFRPKPLRDALAEFTGRPAESFDLETLPKDELSNEEAAQVASGNAAGND